ncbi:MAG: hypothetical protein BWY25_03071 [Chloroflexi bacterium ADurb.Bin222]|nr:MAG: hypothetical protein BWY25_03071 [Chloroflexi bacterium ADurb.Bin222]
MLRTITNAPVLICGHSLLLEIVTTGLAQEARVQVLHMMDALQENVLAQVATLKPQAVIIESRDHNRNLARALSNQGIVLITLDSEESVATVAEESRIPVNSMMELAQVIQRALV